MILYLAFSPIPERGKPPGIYVRRLPSGGTLYRESLRNGIPTVYPGFPITCAAPALSRVLWGKLALYSWLLWFSVRPASPELLSSSFPMKIPRLGPRPGLSPRPASQMPRGKEAASSQQRTQEGLFLFCHFGPFRPHFHSSSMSSKSVFLQLSFLYHCRRGRGGGACLSGSTTSRLKAGLRPVICKSAD